MKCAKQMHSPPTVGGVGFPSSGLRVDIAFLTVENRKDLGSRAKGAWLETVLQASFRSREIGLDAQRYPSSIKSSLSLSTRECVRILEILVVSTIIWIPQVAS
jgi:hypothetical protein